MFKWAASHELLPVAVYQALVTVPDLRRDRSAAREPRPISPVSDQTIIQTMPHLSPIVADMVSFQRLQWAYHAARRGRRVLFVSQEMGRVELASKIAAGLAGLSTQQVRMGRLAEDEQRRLVEATCEAGKQPLTIFDRPGQTVADNTNSAFRVPLAMRKLLSHGNVARLAQQENTACGFLTQDTRSPPRPRRSTSAAAAETQAS